jgi:hypothetical protein
MSNDNNQKKAWDKMSADTHGDDKKMGGDDKKMGGSTQPKTGNEDPKKM